ncbi:shikimate dehydrogenase [Curvibacter sp. APW13]|uniref:shikimate dehydrogenase n=1 Tax=Curvibacter sp. APW13 TaxID=3077236 RepID=UPI0028DFCC96|nr:shikimate dehydrogenase [Curvibacter sp. APW13]MDT8991212.1 shikimate dehydrogenase [Curvibacter sp. APW13]
MADTHPYRLAGVMGWPVAHSRSPLIHNHWIGELGLNGAYVLLPVQPQQLETALRGLPALGFAGCNLTIPHKVDCMRWLDQVEPLAQRIGAVNTVVVSPEGALLGRNTDAFGFIESLHQEHPQWKAASGPVCVIGAGGAARAVLCALLDDGVPLVRLCNRSIGKAQELAEEFGSRVQALPWEERNDALTGITLLVNTTNQGMHGQPALELSLQQLPNDAVVADIIYVPLVTPLLQAAQARGNPTMHGLGMLLHQARPAFEAWFGIRPEVTPALWEKAIRSL